MSKIGVFDSGIGGLTVLEELKKVLPKEDYIFYADSGNNPYGEKTDEELRKIVSNVVDFLINKDCKLIVIACNTATTRCIAYLREKYPNIVFIGTEPAVKVEKAKKETKAKKEVKETKATKTTKTSKKEAK